jgi:hypothetical protein
MTMSKTVSQWKMILASLGNSEAAERILDELAEFGGRHNTEVKILAGALPAWAEIRFAYELPNKILRGLRGAS